MRLSIAVLMGVLTLAGAGRADNLTGNKVLEICEADDPVQYSLCAGYMIGLNEGGANLPSFLSAKNYSPFISKDLDAALKSPVLYRVNAGATPAHGIRAELLPEICGVFLSARRKGELHASQEHLAMQAEILMEAFAKVGIVALVDEATGYQRDRSHDALRLLLSKYIADGLQKWLKTFPDAFFAELDRLYDNDTSHGKRPQYYGRFINKYVYDPLENGYVKKELDKLNINDDGKRKAKFHQWLNEDGRNMLIESAIVALRVYI